MQLQLPIGQCRISNELVYEGTNSLGVRLTGVKGFNGQGTAFGLVRAELRHHDADAGLQWLFR